MREAAIKIATAALGTDGDAASALACQLFDSVMEAEDVGVPAATVYDGPREGAVEATVRRVVGDVDGAAESLAGFVERVGQLAERETRLAASSTMERNVERAAKTKNGRRVRFARVPTKSVPCPWCAMLASRGFVYTSSENAEAGSHHHCTCTVVPGVKGSTRVAGYDPEHYKDVWLNRERYEKKGDDRTFANSLRQSPLRQLTDSEIESLVADAESIGVDPSILRFNEGTATAFSERTGLVTVRGDVLPDMSSTNNRDRMTSRAVLAHECYGHAQFPNSSYPPGHWADEFRASYRAALDTPGLTDEERMSLMVDAYERAADAGVKVRYNDKYREIVYGYGGGGAT